MNRDLAKELFTQLDLPAEIVEEAIDELDFMARYKYDDYEMYAPAGRFLEHLFRWLKQFKTREERLAALAFVRRDLIFISQREIQDLARYLYYELIVPKILDKIIADKQLPPFAYGAAFTHFQSYLRGCLFVGLSDGAKIDFFRRHNIDVGQEQVLPYYRSSAMDYLRALREDTQNPQASFWAVFLIDDFTGSGYTLLRENIDSDTRETSLGGSLQRVYEQHREIIDSAASVYLCEYVATHSAIKNVTRMLEKAEHYSSKLTVLCPLILPADVSITPIAADADVAKAAVVSLCEKYYDSSFENHNTKKGGGIKFGYGQQGLPLILYSNTPNNSLFLLWLNTRADAPVPFTSLFTRIDRHKPL